MLCFTDPDAGNATLLWHEGVETLPTAPGSYVLLLHLPHALTIERPASARLEPGWYIYTGSAKGRGGPKARVGRHFRRDKPVRWHIDQLTNDADRILVAAFQAYEECELLRGLADSDEWEFPHAGFGSSDCRTCTAHLLKRRH